MAEFAKKWTDELCSLLDEATILSISSDYDLQDPQEFAAARDVLLAISKDVVAEEATGFNPSGVGLDGLVDIDKSNQGASEAAHAADSDIKSSDGFTTTTESSQPKSHVSAASSKTSTQESPGNIRVVVFDGLSDEEKERQLCAMFVSLKPIDVRLALQKCKGDASFAIDELLNLQWLEQAGQRPKGIDGFYVSDDDVPNRKKKGRKKKRKGSKALNTRSSDSVEASEADNRRNEKENADNVAFVSDRFKLSESESTSIYERNNASLGAAIVEILDNYIAVGLQPSSFEQLPEVQELANKVSWVPHEYFAPIFEITPSHQAALDVVNMLADYFEKPAYLKYDVSYSLVASASDLEPLPATPPPAGLSSPKQFPKSTFARPSLQLGPQAWARPSTSESPTASAAAIAAYRNHSFTSASSAFRKGRSDPLFRQAAAYYAERGREQAASHHQATSVEASYLVDRSSTRDSIDLHGVTVQDGTDIAIDRVWRWYDGLGEERVRKARDGFTVVTGLGRHSTDGKSRLRINVFKALVADGWKVEVMTGSYLVTGRRR
ncbi:Uu.00g126680.m01.CDS01 [Anthostomella pinea]|uniref:Uu.00g126680.m01.CDS01 n=1 Tax=Anthostomella pinea TaxID=933095 RepID=A0AAI8VJ28_9PEZI|nr:Uu.00g126680.m01.CDS01 [Anthostomella pinea]